MQPLLKWITLWPLSVIAGLLSWTQIKKIKNKKLWSVSIATEWISVQPKNGLGEKSLRQYSRYVGSFLHVSKATSTSKCYETASASRSWSSKFSLWKEVTDLPFWNTVAHLSLIYDHIWPDYSCEHMDCAIKQLAARSPCTIYKAQGYSVQCVISIIEQMSALFRNRRHSRKASVSLEK